MSFIDVFPFVSLQVVLLSVVTNSFVLKRKGIRISNKTKKSRLGKFILHPLFLLLFHLLMFELGKPILGISLLPDAMVIPLLSSVILKITGVGVVVFSLILLVSTLYSFGHSFRFGLHPENKGKLITKGIFRYSRNPFFLSILLYFVGIALLIPSVFFITIAVATIISIHFFILKEENFLLENYGEEYCDYKQKVRRYF